jgi:hypothetical protein
MSSHIRLGSRMEHKLQSNQQKLQFKNHDVGFKEARALARKIFETYNISRSGALEDSEIA